MGYALNDGTGNNDVIAVSGRARKINASCDGDACGVWGSAYAEWGSLITGGVMGVEAHIYNNRSHNAMSGDRPNPIGTWTAGTHIYSDSDYRVTAGVFIDFNRQRIF
jgi:hypothetical protein